MAEIIPFRALHYDSRKSPDLGAVVTQPYDKISPEMQARYYGLSPYNLVRIIRGRTLPQDGPGTTSTCARRETSRHGCKAVFWLRNTIWPFILIIRNTKFPGSPACARNGAVSSP